MSLTTNEKWDKASLHFGRRLPLGWQVAEISAESNLQFRRVIPIFNILD
jgi:hypothetical protein